MKRIEPLREVQKSHIIQVLRHTSGDLARTRAILGVSPAELETLLRQHGLEAEQFASKNSATLGED